MREQFSLWGWCKIWSCWDVILPVQFQFPITICPHRFFWGINHFISHRFDVWLTLWHIRRRNTSQTLSHGHWQTTKFHWEPTINGQGYVGGSQNMDVFSSLRLPFVGRVESWDTFGLRIFYALFQFAYQQC